MNLQQFPEAIALRAKKTVQEIACAPSDQKNEVLGHMARRLEKHADKIVAANNDDLNTANQQHLAEKLIQRLRFDEAKIQSRINSLKKIAALDDPVGKIFRENQCANGLHVARLRVPLGVILMIYEARPHVTVNAGAFCLKSGNAAILRGGSEAQRCNELLGQMWQESLVQAGLSGDIIQVISGSHEDIDQLLSLNESINLVIPRGGKGLIDSVSRKSRIPVIKHYAGVCHQFIDKDVDLEQAIQIIIDSKCLMPEVCNALESLLIHQDLLPRLDCLIKALQHAGITIKGCQRTCDLISDAEPATEQDWRTEYLDMILSVRIVDSVKEAIDHINHYGSHHTDGIVTRIEDHAEEFVKRVDSGVVLVNASTMFCDGESLGMGAEIGISTDKLHARGPMGLEELTSYKFVIHGQQHIMGSPRELHLKELCE